MVTEFDRWVSQNNIPTRFEYGKGWWDYVELVRRFASKFGIEDVRVVGHYVVQTPPPEEKRPMPAVVLTRRDVLIALKHDFGGLARWKEWTVSVRRTTPYSGPILMTRSMDRTNLTSSSRVLAEFARAATRATLQNIDAKLSANMFIRKPGCSRA
jgi:hypothetical protein